MAEMSLVEKTRKCFACSRVPDDHYSITSNAKTSALLYDAIGFDVATLSTAKIVCRNCFRQLTYFTVAKKKKKEYMKLFESLNRDTVTAKPLKRPCSPTRNENNYRLKLENIPLSVKVS